MAESSVITCLAWIPKGFAKALPVEEEFTEQDANKIKTTQNITDETQDQQMKDLHLDKYDHENGYTINRTACLC